LIRYPVTIEESDSKNFFKLAVDSLEDMLYDGIKQAAQYTKTVGTTQAKIFSNNLLTG
jgi:hypothetical protein